MSDNTRLPAYPLPLVQNSEGEVKDASDWNGNMGFTKLELASLMAMQGILAETADRGSAWVAKASVEMAKAVLEEANK